MERLVRYFFLLSLLLLAVAGIILFRESRPVWKQYQEEYREFLQDSASLPAQKERAGRFAVAVQQDWLPELEKADRCRTCHIGVDDPEAPKQPPLAPHVDITPHSFEKFGCTICHDGEGLATRLPDAHEDLLPNRLIEASCGKCHGLEGPGIEKAPTYTAGYELLTDKACAGCHLLAGERKREFHGPGLAGIRSKVNRKWLENWLHNPQNYLPDARMADFLLSREEVDSLADFLLKQEMPAETAAVFYEDTAGEEKILDGLSADEFDELAEDGKVIFGRLRCLSCHKLNGRGGTLGPDLSRISLKTNRAWLSAWIRSPATFNPHTRMPTFNMTMIERLGVVEYLIRESEFNVLDDDEEPEPVLAGPAATENTAAPESGRDLFLARGCVNCHRLPGLTANPEFAPSLKTLADRKIAKIDFGETTIPRTLPDYIAVKLQNPRIYGDKLKMPDFGFSPQEAGRLTTLLLGRTGEVPSSYTMEKKTDDIPLPAGEMGQIFERYKCLGCHRLGGRGGSMAPDLAFEGSKVRRQWLKTFLEKPYAIRPYLVERMPRFNLAEAEIDILADYAGLVWRSNGIDAVPLPPGGGPETGRRLYFEKYVCQACHSIDGEGGYYGPALENVGSRLKSSWIDTRLVNPHPFDPDAREPVLAIPPQDRADLLAFLGTLRTEENP